MTSFPRTDRSRAVAVWLFAVATLVMAMVVVGGATRLTGSGLSITEWKPVTGALPPLSHADWTAAFDGYRQTTQYKQLNAGMSLAEFQGIFWWEWAHRALGRLVGAAFLVPFLIFRALKKLPRRLTWPCVVLFALGGLQGLVGWLMVSSGLNQSQLLYVAPERLALHLGLAFILLSALIWTGLEARFGKPRLTDTGRWPAIGAVVVVCVLLQILLGALVAGNHAGLIYNDWPMFNGAWLPDAYGGGGVWRTVFHSQGAVQLHHRIGAYLLFAGAITLAVTARRSVTLSDGARQLATALAVLVTAQAALGIITLMQVTPLPLAMAHQVLAAMLLAVAVAFAWRVRRA